MLNVCCEDGVYFSFLSCSIRPILVKVGVNFLMILDINLYFFSYVIEEEQCVKSVYSKSKLICSKCVIDYEARWVEFDYFEDSV